MVHIYTANMQPATCFIDQCGEVPINGGWKSNVLIYADCCNRQRPAKDCVVQCYYDGLSVWCAEGFGCKDPLVIAEKKAKEFHNRSVGQKARYAVVGRK